MADAPAKKFQDENLNRLHEQARARGDLDIKPCCRHIKAAHLKTMCRTCWYAGNVCPGYAKDPNEGRTRHADDETPGG